MDVKGSHTFNAPRERVWQLLLDPDALRGALPGTKEFTQAGPDAYDAVMSVGVGSVKGTYNAKIQVLDKNEPDSYRLVVEGTGRPGFLKGDGTIELEDKGETTGVHYHGQA